MDKKYSNSQLSEENLEEVAGGKGELKKGSAALMSSLMLLSGAQGLSAHGNNMSSGSGQTISTTDSGLHKKGKIDSLKEKFKGFFTKQNLKKYGIPAGMIGGGTAAVGGIGMLIYKALRSPSNPRSKQMLLDNLKRAPGATIKDRIISVSKELLPEVDDTNFVERLKKSVPDAKLHDTLEKVLNLDAESSFSKNIQALNDAIFDIAAESLGILSTKNHVPSKAVQASLRKELIFLQKNDVFSQISKITSSIENKTESKKSPLDDINILEALRNTPGKTVAERIFELLKKDSKAVIFEDSGKLIDTFGNRFGFIIPALLHADAEKMLNNEVSQELINAVAKDAIKMQKLGDKTLLSSPENESETMKVLLSMRKNNKDMQLRIMKIAEEKPEIKSISDKSEKNNKIAKIANNISSTIADKSMTEDQIKGEITKNLPEASKDDVKFIIDSLPQIRAENEKIFEIFKIEEGDVPGEVLDNMPDSDEQNDNEGEQAKADKDAEAPEAEVKVEAPKADTENHAAEVTEANPNKAAREARAKKAVVKTLGEINSTSTEGIFNNKSKALSDYIAKNIKTIFLDTDNNSPEIKLSNVDHIKRLINEYKISPDVKEKYNKFNFDQRRNTIWGNLQSKDSSDFKEKLGAELQKLYEYLLEKSGTQ